MSQIKIEFVPGCFDHLDASQEDIDNFVKEITEMVESGEIFELSEPLNLDDLAMEDGEHYDFLISQLEKIMLTDEEQ